MRLPFAMFSVAPPRHPEQASVAPTVGFTLFVFDGFHRNVCKRREETEVCFPLQKPRFLLLKSIPRSAALKVHSDSLGVE
jgi:hypothetical protein